VRPLGLKARRRVGVKVIVRIELEAIERAGVCGSDGAGEVAIGFAVERDTLVFAGDAARRIAFDNDVDACAARCPDAKVDAAIELVFSADRQPSLCGAVLHSYAFRKPDE
jgi:hypothetical protein